MIVSLPLILLQEDGQDENLLIVLNSLCTQLEQATYKIRWNEWKAYLIGLSKLQKEDLNK